MLWSTIVSRPARHTTVNYQFLYRNELKSTTTTTTTEVTNNKKKMKSTTTKKLWLLDNESTPKEKAQRRTGPRVNERSAQPNRRNKTNETCVATDCRSSVFLAFHVLPLSFLTFISSKQQQWKPGASLYVFVRFAQIMGIKVALYAFLFAVVRRTAQPSSTSIHLVEQNGLLHGLYRVVPRFRFWCWSAAVSILLERRARG